MTEGSQTTVTISPCEFRPPPLRTTNTYDDDEPFNSVALNLLSRQRALGCYHPSSADIIRSVLLKPQDRTSFLEALQNRKCRMATMSPTLSSLIDDVDRTFGKDLKAIVDSEKVSLKRQDCQTSSCPSTNNPYEPPKKQKSRRFFSDADVSGFFRSRRIQNLDWSLVEAVAQVQSLRLDGTDEMSSGENSDYEAPDMAH